MHDSFARCWRNASLLSSIGGVLALGVAYLGIKALLALKPADLQRPEQVHLSLGVLLFTMAVSFAAGIVFGVIPALYVSNTDVNSVLKQSASGQRHPSRIRSGLVIGEVSLAVVLLVGAVFMVRSLVSVLNVDPGFRADHVLTMHFSLPPSRYATKDQMAAFCRELLQRVDALPGVKAGELLRRPADDAHPHDEVHRRWPARGQARQRADLRHARHYFA